MDRQALPALVRLADLTPAVVALDGLVDEEGQPVRLRALVETTTWNGWTIPHFEEGTVRRLVDALDRQEGCSATLDTGRRMVVVRNEEADPPEEVFAARQVGRVWLYPVGAASWCWESATSD